jgi:hypothetical protein
MIYKGQTACRNREKNGVFLIFTAYSILDL